MGETEFENEGGRVAPEELTPRSTTETEGATPGAGWGGPSQEEWKNLIDSNKRMADRLAEQEAYFQDPGDVPDQGGGLEDLDLSDPYTMAALVNSIVEERLKSVTPYVRNAAQDQGKRQMETMFGDLEKEVGSFDHDLAERTAFYFFDQSGDAEKSVREAAKYAAEVRKRERDDATSEMRSRATRRGSGASEEVQGTGSAVAGEAPAQSYDEVIEKYVHQTEF